MRDKSRLGLRRGTGRFKLTGEEATLAFFFAVMGFMFSSRPWLLFLAGLDPLQGLLVYYVILYAVLLILSRLGLTILGVRIRDPAQTLGLTMITFAFFIIVNWENEYIQHVTMGSDLVSPVFYQSEDGATFYMWHRLFPDAGWEAWRLLTYVFTPFILALAGGFLASRKVRLSPA